MATSKFDHLKTRRENERARIRLSPMQRVIDVTPFCGPEADLVMIDWYHNSHSAFLSPTEALALASGLKTAALSTMAAGSRTVSLRSADPGMTSETDATCNS